MARTPLMRALQQLAREHSAAKALGVGVDEFREREAEDPRAQARRLAPGVAGKARRGGVLAP